MSVYLIAFISAVVLYTAFIIASRYMEHRHGKSHEATNGISQFLQISVMLTFGWWILERFCSGFDSGFGWWLLAFALGGIISVCARIATNAACDKLGLKGENTEKVPMQKGVKTAIHILMFTLDVGFTIFFIYGLYAHTFDGIGETIVALFVIALFAFCSYDRMKKIIRERRNSGE